MITQTDVKRLFDYDPDTGFCARLTGPCNSVKIGDQIGWVVTCGGGLKYWATELYGSQNMVHRLIWLWMTGKTPEGDIDHIDGDGLNNSWSNLREVTHSANMRNMKIRSNNRSGMMGVHFCNTAQRWIARINTEAGTRKSLGYFDTLGEAKSARVAAEKDSDYHKNHGRCTE